MYLFTIENLCLAAEATIVLLLLAFAWRPGKNFEKNGEIDPANTTSWEPAKAAYRLSCLYRGLYLHHWSNQSSHKLAKPFETVCHEDEVDATGLPEPWMDRLTHTHNRCALDSILNAWLSIDTSLRGASCLSMLTLNTYSDLVSSNGAMTTECALRAIAKHMSTKLASTAIIARYQPDRFVVLHFGTNVSQCHSSMEQLHSDIAAPNFFEFAEHSIPVPCIVSIVSLGQDSEVSVPLEQLESGYLYAEENGVSLVSRRSEVWLDKQELAPKPAEPKANQSASPFETDARIVQAPSKSFDKVDNVTKPTDKSIMDETSGSESEVNSSTTSEAMVDTSSTDVSAVASSDDIAALFAQINSKKGNDPKVSKPAAPESSGANPSPIDPSTIAESKAADLPPSANAPAGNDLTETASADDIAALFASTKPSASKSFEESPSTAPPIANLDEVDLHEAASPDDIASLFATIKPVVKQKPPQAVGHDDHIAPAVSAPAVDKQIDLEGSASADDIAALFASMKPSNQIAPVAESMAANPQGREQASKAQPIDPNETASADDIASLFATIKPTGKTSSMPAPAVPLSTPHSTLGGHSDSLAESATANDIASLFETVQSAITSNAGNTTESNPPPIPVGEELGEVASADDIEALFAAMKK